MSDYNEQLLSEIVVSLHEKLPLVDFNKVRGSLSKILINYNVNVQDGYVLASNLPDKIKLFITSKRIEGLSEKTLDGYKIELGLFSKAINKKVEHITTSDIRVYLGELDGLKKSTVNKKLNILRSFFGFMHEEEIISNNPTLKIKQIKEEKRMGKSLTIEELEMLRESCETVRQRAFLESFYSTGCRLSEMQQLNIEDVNTQSLSCKVIGKGNKEREVYFSFKAMYHLKKYLNSRNDDESALIVTARKPYRRLSNRAIQDEIKKIARNANLEHKVTTHVLRHTFATLTLNNGADITAIQELLGHKSADTTLRYARITEERKRDQHKKYLIQ